MNEHIQTVSNSDAPQPQGEHTNETEAEGSVVGVIFYILGGLNLFLCPFVYDQLDAIAVCAVLGGGFFCLAIGSILCLLAKIASRLQRLIKTNEMGFEILISRND